MARGGAERQVVDLSAKFTSRGWNVAVLSMTTPYDFVDELEAAGCKRVFRDVGSGTLKHRPQLDACSCFSADGGQRWCCGAWTGWYGV